MWLASAESEGLADQLRSVIALDEPVGRRQEGVEPDLWRRRRFASPVAHKGASRTERKLFVWLQEVSARLSPSGDDEEASEGGVASETERDCARLAGFPSLLEGLMRENCTFGLSGGRR